MSPSARRTLAGFLLLAALQGAAGCGSRASTPGLPERAGVEQIRARLLAERGHPVLLSFWATWCQPCVAELPTLGALHRERPAGLRVLAVSLDGFLSGDADAPRVVGEFLKRAPAPVDHLVYSGTQDALFGAFDLPGSIPYAILFDAAGREIQRFDRAASETEIRSLVEARSQTPDAGSGNTAERL